MGSVSYKKVVKELDKRGASAEEVVKALMGEDALEDWASIWAACRIYMEDGGRLYGAQDFWELAQRAQDATPSWLEEHDLKGFLKGE